MIRWRRRRRVRSGVKKGGLLKGSWKRVEGERKGSGSAAEARRTQHYSPQARRLIEFLEYTDPCVPRDAVKCKGGWSL